MPTLDHYLDQAYKIIVVHKREPTDVVDSIRSDMRSVSGFREMVLDRIREMKKVPERRCFVTKIQREFLEGVLNG